MLRCANFQNLWVAKTGMTARGHKSEDEEEVKIKLSKGDLEKVFNAVVKKYAPAEVEHKYMPRAYWDTPALDLDQNNISVRMQYKEGKQGEIGGHEQTVKFDLGHANPLATGAVFRREIKDMMPDHQPDLSIVHDAKAKTVLAPFVHKRLKHVFTAAIERRYFEVEIGHGKHKGTVEIAFDVGEIILPHSGRRYPLYEIEIEKKRGSRGAIDKMREMVMDEAKSATIQPLSKSQQGSRLYRRSTGHAKKRKP
jgi:inorganic triphosphatase YgiF